MKTCPVLDCGALIRADALVCHDDWMRLPQWARDELDGLRCSEGKTDLYRRTVAVALAYLNDTATNEPPIEVHIIGSRLMPVETLDVIGRVARAVHDQYAVGWRPGQGEQTDV